jgi:cyclase
MDAAAADAVVDIFSKSDAGELPHLVGVRRRDLFRFHGLYFHLIEASGDVPQRVAEVRENPLFVTVNAQLANYVGAYDAATWRGPADAVAQHFYSWSADPGPGSRSAT